MILKNLLTNSVFKSRIVYNTVLLRYNSNQDRFKDAVELLKTLKKSPQDDEKLDLYGLFKQSTEGKNTKPKPNMFDVVSKFKYDAWAKYGDLSKEDAQIKYIIKVEELIQKYGSTNTKSPPPNEETNLDEKIDSEEQNDNKESIVITLENSIKTLRFNRPKKYNSFTADMYKTVTKDINETSKNDEIKALFITGTGKYYSSGNDLSAFTTASDPIKMAEEGIQILKEFVESFINCEKPIIAVVNGHAFGILVTTLGLCDYIIATNEATFSTPFSQTAQIPEGCSTYTFPRIFGTSLANKMLLFNYKLTAQEALNHGFVSKVVDKNDLDICVRDFKNYIINNCASNSLVWGKKLIRTDEIKEELRKVNLAECENLKKAWFSPEFPEFIIKFLNRKKNEK